ncbi:hypothetical protein [Flavobacterium sp.]|uniref:hypothetical protein n=1 Tax=Flavobacterium sp. TaxID=239 RepID=UPI00286B8E4F|nr:hypothetical protein [Flavobacterium sp.]
MTLNNPTPLAGYIELKDITPVPIGNITKNAIQMIGDPVAPMTTANYDKKTNTFMLRITVFQRSDEKTPPQLWVNQITGDYYALYFAVADTDTDYRVWYFAAPNQPFVQQEIKVYNGNADPKTSRGTVTIVQSSAT